MKVAIAYSGWEADGKNNTRLVGKIMTAGLENSNEFHAIREAMFQSKYNTDQIEVLSAAKAPKKDGKGNSYIDLITHHRPLLEAMQTASRKVFKKVFE